MWQIDLPKEAAPIGYRFLVEKLQIRTLPHYRWSYVGNSWDSKEFKYDDLNLEVYLYPKTSQIDKTPLKHLEFALKHEGLNLPIIQETLKALNQDSLIDYIQEHPTGKYARKIWFLYEFLLKKTLPLGDVGRGAYIPLLDPKDYFCIKGTRSPRHRILNNLIGNSQFSPIVRKSKRLKKYLKEDLHKIADQLTEKYNINTLTRAIRYLYTKETIASWEIEREKPSKSKIARFVTLLQKDFSKEPISKDLLVSIQKEIVDPRFASDSFRDFQNYVGEEPLPGDVIVHYICPKPEDLQKLMQGLIRCSEEIFGSDLDPVIAAAVLSFGFVLLHPFEDGNGRLHRFLIHYTLSKLGFTPAGIVFPISAVILREEKDYDKALESFSAPLSQLITEYDINDRGEMTVQGDTYDYYRFIDMTPMAEFLYRCVKRTIYTDLEDELNFLSRYDEIKKGLKEIVDMPDRDIDLFIKCVRQNGGQLSSRKRDSLFQKLHDEEISRMENVISENTVAGK